MTDANQTADAMLPIGWTPEDGCPVCNGDCCSANPPVYFCPVQEYNKRRDVMDQ